MEGRGRAWKSVEQRGRAVRAGPPGKGRIYEERGGCVDSTAELVNKAARRGAR